MTDKYRLVISPVLFISVSSGFFFVYGVFERICFLTWSMRAFAVATLIGGYFFQVAL